MAKVKGTVLWCSAALGTAVGILTVLCSCAAGAGMMASGTVDVAHMGLWAACTVVGSALCAGLAAMLAGGGAPEAALAAAGELVVLMALNGVLCGGKMEGFAVTALAIAGGCGGAVLLRLGKGSGRRPRRRRNR